MGATAIDPEDGPAADCQRGPAAGRGRRPCWLPWHHEWTLWELRVAKVYDMLALPIVAYETRRCRRCGASRQRVVGRVAG